MFLKSIGQGAATQTLCAVMPGNELVGGGYYADCALQTPRADTESEQLAGELWRKSEELTTGLRQ